MLGLSVGKFLLLVLIVAVVWTGFKFMRRVEMVRRALHEELRRRQPSSRPREIEAEDLTKCGVCGAYVAARSAGNCGRPDCPWGR